MAFDGTSPLLATKEKRTNRHKTINYPRKYPCATCPFPVCRFSQRKVDHIDSLRVLNKSKQTKQRRIHTVHTIEWSLGGNISCASIICAIWRVCVCVSARLGVVLIHISAVMARGGMVVWYDEWPRPQPILFYFSLFIGGWRHDNVPINIIIHFVAMFVRHCRRHRHGHHN